MRLAPLRYALLACGLLAAASLASSPAEAAEALGLDLSSEEFAEADPGLGLDLSGGYEEDFTKGARVVAVPPLRANGRPDLAAYKLIHQALAERLGARLAPEAATLEAVESQKLRGRALTTSEGLTKLAVAVRAPRVLVFAFERGKLTAVALSKPSGAPVRESAWAWTRRTDLAQVQEWVGLFLAANKDMLQPPLRQPKPVAEAPVQQVGVGEIEAEAQREAAREVARSAVAPPMAIVLVGAGTTIRDFKARTDQAIVPQAQGPMAGVGFDVALYPLRMIDGLDKVLGGQLRDFSLEGHYRRTLASARFAGADAGEGPACGVEDDEALARAAWRYVIGGAWPRIGLSFGVAWERALMQCEEGAALSTRYRSTELHLKILQPLVGERLQLELAGGPRFLFSTRAAGNPDRAFSAEAWLIGRPVDWFFARAGGRWTNTRLRTWPEGISITDIRYFVGLEVGAAL